PGGQDPAGGGYGGWDGYWECCGCCGYCGCWGYCGGCCVPGASRPGGIHPRPPAYGSEPRSGVLGGYEVMAGSPTRHDGAAAPARWVRVSGQCGSVSDGVGRCTLGWPCPRARSTRLSTMPAPMTMMPAV